MSDPGEYTKPYTGSNPLNTPMEMHQIGRYMLNIAVPSMGSIIIEIVSSVIIDPDFLKFSS